MNEHTRAWLEHAMAELEENRRRPQEIAEETERLADEARELAMGQLRRRKKEQLAPPADPFTIVPVKLVRDWIRSELLPDIVPRLHETAMGAKLFETLVVSDDKKTVIATMAAAPPSTQVQAMTTLLDAALGHSRADDESASELPGVFALGELELVAIQEERTPTGHGNGNGRKTNGRAILASGEGSPPEFSETDGATVSPAMAEAADAAHTNLEYVEIEEHPTRGDAEEPEDGPPRVAEGPPTLAQEILARRHAQKRRGR
jgi:hypothetical protein